MTHTGEKPFACEVCDYRFWSKSDFRGPVFSANHWPPMKSQEMSQN